MRSRYYDPVSGRFISEDPSCQGLDWFMYAGNRPTCAKDYSGNGLTLDDIKEIKEIAVSIVALLHFEDKLKECKSSLEVEEEYEKFLEKWKETVPSDDDVADAFKDLIKDANGESSSFGDVLDELKDGVLDGAKLVILSLAYTARLDWYIKDIDRDD